MSGRGDEATKTKALANRCRIIDADVAKALGNAFRQQILWILNERTASPTEIAKELGETLNKVCHHIEVLEEANCIELAYTRTVGNRIQNFYTATARAFLDDAEWPTVPESVRGALRATLLQDLLDDAVDSVVEGTYDAYAGSHMSWIPMVLDKQGRTEMTKLLERALLGAIDIEESTRDRLESSGATGTSYTVSILGYPSVGGRKKVGPPTAATKLKASMKSPMTKTGKAEKAKGAGKANPS